MNAAPSRLLKSPAFLVGMALFLGTVLLALLRPALHEHRPRTSASVCRTRPPRPSIGWAPITWASTWCRCWWRGSARRSMSAFWRESWPPSLGTLIGVYGGYKGGLLDDVLTVGTNLFLVIPSLIVLIL